MILVEFVVVLAAIFLGARLGGIAIGFAGGLGVLVLALLGVTPGELPLAVISIIMSVIAAYLMTFMAGTGHTVFSTMPVIIELAKENDIRPARPLSVAVVASQIAITASPVSAAVVILAGFLEPKGVDYLQLLAVAIPATFLACMATAAIRMALDKARGDQSLHSHPEYQRRLAAGTVRNVSTANVIDTAAPAPGGKRSVLIFLVGLLGVMSYAVAISEKVGLITDPVMERDAAIIAFMLSIAAIIVIACKVASNDILAASTFKSGMSASICVLGVAWLGTTFVTEHEKAITDFAGDLLKDFSGTLAIVLFIASALLYSQAATTTALMPTALAIGVAPLAAVAAFPAVSALFVLPTYPILLAAVQMDDTGTTQIGKYVFNHPFLLPGVINITIAVTLGFLFGSFIL